MNRKNFKKKKSLNLIEKSLKTIDNFVDFNILKISKTPAPILFE